MGAILIDDELGVPRSGERTVYLTRCPEVAAHWAQLGPGERDEGRGGIIVLDRRKLAELYGPQLSEGLAGFGEHEERIVAPVTNLSTFLVGAFWLDERLP